MLSPMTPKNKEVGVSVGVTGRGPGSVPRASRAVCALLDLLSLPQWSPSRGEQRGSGSEGCSAPPRCTQPSPAGVQTQLSLAARQASAGCISEHQQGQGQAPVPRAGRGSAHFLPGPAACYAQPRLLWVWAASVLITELRCWPVCPSKFTFWALKQSGRFSSLSCLRGPSSCRGLGMRCLQAEPRRCGSGGGCGWSTLVR